MARKIDETKISRSALVKLTDEPFDDVIGHDNGPRKYFTIENNNQIYRRLREEVEGIYYFPYLGPCVDFGAGDACLEEDGDIFKFYIIDRAYRFDYQEFDNIKDAIERLVEFEISYNDIKDPDKYRQIFYDVLGLN